MVLIYQAARRQVPEEHTTALNINDSEKLTTYIKMAFDS